MAYSAPSSAVPAPSWVSRPATTADHAAEPRLKAKIATRTGNRPIVAGEHSTCGRRTSKRRMEEVGRYVTNPVPTNKFLALMLVASRFKSDVFRFQDGFASSA